MNSHYEILTEVHFEHEYFNGLFSPFTVLPNAASRKVLKNFGMEFREQYGRFFILFDAFHGGVKRSRQDVLHKNLYLAFSLELIEPLLFNYTATIKTDIRNNVFYFSNRNITAESLNKGAFVSDKDLYKYPLSFFPEEGLAKSFGVIVLKLGTGMLKVYSVKFEALATYWRYILVSDHLKTISNPSIIDKETQLPFNGPKSIKIPSGGTKICFVSPEPIKLSSRAINRYQLLENSTESPLRGRVVIRALQNPNHTYMSLLPPEEDAEANRNYSEIII